ncbi:AraC family transcriptional regulator [Azospira sp. I13]|uniref:AraC family transcriptional regulator n=1 Tax=Azospira sp. I13 TaxID=1765050 RepID=UPI000D4916CC|nr:helix-turn-helix domain-containing protein [Azospira sp. I13]GBG01360.1 AraC family transcriptional regulator [Azospira sp. I13]
MKTFHLLPTPELRPFIDRFWGWEADSSEAIRLPMLLPGTGAELYFHYGTPFHCESSNGATNSSLSQGHLFCIRCKPLTLMPNAGIGFIAVRFRIGMLHRFTPIPATELIDATPSVEDLWGLAGADLTRRLSYADNQRERIALIQTFLVGKLREDSADLLIERGLSQLYRRSTGLTVDALATLAGLGRRQLERRWRAFSGQTPNDMRCLSRFQHTIRQLMLNPSADTTDVALASGYYDQAHFIHDFRSRVGSSPEKYLQLARSKTHFYNTPLGKAGNLPTPNHP